MFNRIPIILLSILLCGCATNMASVGSFGVAAQNLSDHSSAVLSRYIDACREREGLVVWERGAMQSALGWWQANGGTGSDAHIGRLSRQLEILDGALRTFDAECPRQEELLGMVPRLSLVLSEYAKALQALAGDNFVIYNGTLELGDAVGKIQKRDGSGAMLSGTEVRAVDGLVRAIRTMATLEYRQKKLEEALSDESRADFRTIAVRLQQLTSSYELSIATELLMLQAFSSDLAAALGNGDIPEPVAVSELRARLDERTRMLQQVPDSFPAYRQALEDMDDAFAAAAQSVHQPLRAEIEPRVRAFAQSAWRAEQALRSAFREI